MTTKPRKISEWLKSPIFRQRLAAILPRHLTRDRMLRLFAVTVQRTPKLLDASPESVLGALMSVASLGLEPNTAAGHAYLIPYDVQRWNPETRQREPLRTEVQLVIGYRGMIELAYRSGLIAGMHMDVVRSNDHFKYCYGMKEQLEHVPALTEPDGGLLGPAGIICAYAYVRMTEGAVVFDVVPKAEIDGVRDRSAGYQSALGIYNRWRAGGGQGQPPLAYRQTPWVADYAAMAKKTALRRVMKLVPMTAEIAHAQEIDEAPIDYKKVFENALEDESNEIVAAPQLEVDATPTAEMEPVAEPEAAPVEPRRRGRPPGSRGRTADDVPTIEPGTPAESDDGSALFPE